MNRNMPNLIKVNVIDETNKDSDDEIPKKIKIISEDNIKESGDSFSSVVANHYNTIEEKGLNERSKSRIVYLRNFNNWIKSMLINEYLEKYKNQDTKKIVNVLDMGCGKGGDLLKWRNNDIKHIICVDLAEISIEHCEQRYNFMKERNSYGNLFSAEFFAADCSKVRLKDMFKNSGQLFDIVSCQFSFHYSFESLSQAECMLKNAAECLRSGGFFIGTIPDANDIVIRQRKSNCAEFGNDVFKIEFDCAVSEQFPLFGAKYRFFLEDVVDCPEFLVHFPTFTKLARTHGLKLVMKERFQDYYHRMKDKGRGLLGKMQALETFPSFENFQSLEKSNEYNHAKKYLENNSSCSRVGTLSQSEWEAASLYLVFAFIKVDS